jgi:hypothetical protein
LNAAAAILLSLLQKYLTALSFTSTTINDLLASARMSTTKRHTKNTSKLNSRNQKIQSKDTFEPASHSKPQLAKVNSVDDEDGDEASHIDEAWPSVKPSKHFPTKQNTNPPPTITMPPPSSSPPMTPLAQAKSTLTLVSPSAVESRRLRKRSAQTNDPIDTTTTQQIQIETALGSPGRWPEVLYNILPTFLEIFRSPFFVPLCFVLALLCVISSFMASLVEIVDTVQSAGTAIGSCFGFTWQYVGAWM